ncbi:MAG: FAD:protein FMN transferase [Oscillospiraceae bacterium]|nr:FAD:protein FMN transferase [Oscillospiraceae bacterium]
MRKVLFVVITAVCMLFTACENTSEPAEEHSGRWYAMDTFMSVTAYGDSASDAPEEIRDRISKLEDMWSVTDEKSELYALNHGGSGEVSAETAELISFALEIAEKSGGALDPTIYPVLTAWGFTTEEKHVPPADELSRLLELVDYRAVTVFENTVTLRDGMMLDLGAVAKGAASDAAADILRKKDVKSALLNFGGSIMTIGTKPDGTEWRIGVEDPEDKTKNVGVLAVSDLAVVTSGMYERYFIGEDGTFYGHIIDPKNGYPVNNELLSATIIAPEGRLCDALSTAVFVMGTERAEELWRRMGGFDMLLITRSGEVIVTEGAAKRFTLSDRSHTLRVI